MQIGYRVLANRQFLLVGKTMIPVDRIKRIDMNAPNGGSRNCVHIEVEGVDEDDDNFYWNYDDADLIRKFFNAETIQQMREGT